MVMLAEVVDGVIGVDTHRDFHQVEIARASGAVIPAGPAGSSATSTVTRPLISSSDHRAWVPDTSDRDPTETGVGLSTVAVVGARTITEAAVQRG